MTTQLFDEEWYLENNPDVKNAGVNAYEHYLKFGKREGRLPCALPSLSLERKLWGNALGATEEILGRLIEIGNSDTPDGKYSLWVAVSFLHFQKRFRELIPLAKKLLKQHVSSFELFSSQDVLLILIEALIKTGKASAAVQIVDDNENLSKTSRFLAKTALSNQPSSKSLMLSDLFKRYHLTPVILNNSATFFDGLMAIDSNSRFTNLIRGAVSIVKVTVIIPAFNAQQTLKTSVSSIMLQSWKNLEILIIDDCSTDHTHSVALELASKDKRIQVLRNSVNRGAYFTRNLGLCAASGQFVTIMDADDWAHPQKIEKQIKPLVFSRKLRATVSHWVRCTEDLVFTRLRIQGGWVHRNVSSLMIKTSIAKKLGGWDNVKVNADTEFYYRLLKAYGPTSVGEVFPGIPLSFGRITEDSLTQQSDTHLVTQYGGPRKQYTDLAHIWHNHATSLILSRKNLGVTEPFPVPPELLKNASEIDADRNNDEYQRWLQALDEEWYLLAYTDVKMRGIGLHEHYWQLGEIEDRAPSALFVPSAYKFYSSQPVNCRPTWHALKNGWDFSRPLTLKGKAALKGTHLIVVGHQVTSQLFGAERSLLDMLEVLFVKQYRITLILPSAKNKDYVQQCAELVNEIQFIPLPWFSAQREASRVIVDYLTRYIELEQVKAVYVNTLVLYEPVLAAKIAGVTSIVHIRELPENDPDLMHLLGETPIECRNRLLESCDYFVANSKETAEWLDCKQRTKLVYNKVQDSELICSPPAFSNFQVCMLSSNIKKKGIADFFHVAKQCEHDRNIGFNLYGPVTDEVKLALKRHSSNNVKLHGYVADVNQAIQQNHIVLSLSWFKESFGRTVAEAMINNRVVVGYNWGAVGELVDESSGILVEYKDTSAIAQAITSLAGQSDRYNSLATAARERAVRLFSSKSYYKGLSEAIESFLKNRESTA